MITLNLIVPNGPTHTVKVKGAQDLTLADWKALTAIKPLDPLADPTDATYQMVHLFTGISIEELDRISIKGVGEICDFIGEQLVQAQAGSDAFKEAIKDDDGKGYTPPKSIKIGGKKWKVPQDLDHNITWGQWADFQSWSSPEHEANVCADLLALMLVEEGHEYQGTTDEKRALMLQCQMSKAFDLSAFFFANSEQFRLAMNQRSHRFHTWTRHIVGMALKLSPSDTEALISSLKQPS